MYSREQFAKMIDHTILRPLATRDDILRACDEAAQRHFASVCIFPCWVGTAARALQESDVKVCTVISFPFGADTRSAKVFAIRNAIANGAKEVDMVMNLSKFKSGDFDGVSRDISESVDAITSTAGLHDSRRVLLKVIIETGVLSDSEKEVASRIVRDAGADFIKTSTGTGCGGAVADDIRLIRRAIGPTTMGVKASGGIKTVEQAVTLLNAGANRIGTSAGVTIFDSYDANAGLA
ncbi:MAG: deoxyribose-phosphate aldolase [Capsulimonadaceae bacterium]|nr:deoxyribose-phosphate aldolase [Capsulimonadaceae bacterium]